MNLKIIYTLKVIMGIFSPDESFRLPLFQPTLTSIMWNYSRKNQKKKEKMNIYIELTEEEKKAHIITLSLF